MRQSQVKIWLAAHAYSMRLSGQIGWKGGWNMRRGACSF